MKNHQRTKWHAIIFLLLVHVHWVLKYQQNNQVWSGGPRQGPDQKILDKENTGIKRGKSLQKSSMIHSCLTANNYLRDLLIRELIVLLVLPIISESHVQNFPTCSNFQNAMPMLDILYLVDSTLNIESEENHKRILEFLTNFTSKFQKIKSINFAMAQYTPESRLEFDFNERKEAEDGVVSGASIIHQILKAPYTPCLQKADICESKATSLNSIAQLLLLTSERGSRLSVPNLFVYVRSSLFQLPELNPGEVLIKPQSPIHFFVITIGSSPPANLEAFNPIKFAALTVHLAAVDFDALSELVDPLCQSISGFLGNNDQEDLSVASTGLAWSQWLIPLLMFVICTAILIGTILYAIFHFKNEEERYKRLIKNEQEKLHRLDEYYRRKISERSAHEKERERTMLELITESRGHSFNDYFTSRKNHHSQNHLNLTTRTDEPSRASYKSDGKLHRGQLQRRSSEPESLGPRNNHLIKQTNCLHHYQSGSGERTFCQWCDLKSNATGHQPVNQEAPHPFERTLNELPSDHPSLQLPPVDVLFLVDASSSIGLNIFEKIKSDLREIVNEIDVAPGRSRVAIIQFANEPHVYFEFNRYYSIHSVKAAIQRMSYLGGTTHLAKALAFAAGFLSQEQNMKRIHVEHKSMPTPHHDRLQLLIVVSDGISDDNFDQQAAHLHERMLVKIAAIVTKKFYKERLRPITRYDGAIFAFGQKEALTIWIWNQQKLWNENYGLFVERERSFQHERLSHTINDEPISRMALPEQKTSSKEKSKLDQNSPTKLELEKQKVSKNKLAVKKEVIEEKF